MRRSDSSTSTVLSAIRSTAALAGLASVLTLAALTSTARGTALDDVYACVFDGVTNSLADIKAPPWLNGHGTYNFASTTPAQCVHVDVDAAVGAGDPDDDTGVWEGTITSTGSYQNIVCGTGHAHGHPWLDDAAAGTHHDPSQDGHAAITHPSVSTLALTSPAAGGSAPNNDAPLFDIRYEIEFLAGQGYLALQGVRDSHPAGAWLQTASFGVVSIDPIPRPGYGGQSLVNTTTGCVTSPAWDFTINASVAFAVKS